MRLNNLDLDNNEERATVLGALRDGKHNEQARELLLHVLNVSTRRLPCAYYGRSGDGDLVGRCLATDLDERRERSMPCPFYDKKLDSKCNYPYNIR